MDLFTWSAERASAISDRRGFAPPINSRCAADTMQTARGLAQPRRLHRTRRKNRVTPAGAVYVGRPTIWSNPFSGRNRIGHKRSVIFYAAWLRGDCSPGILKAAGFSRAETVALERRRQLVLERLSRLAGRDLQCWCPTTSGWCHADVLLGLANHGGRP